MGHRDVRRVPLDFDWPLGKVWDGYLVPTDIQLPDCPACDGTGWSPEARRLTATFYDHQEHYGSRGWGDQLTQEDVDALVEANRLYDFTHRIVEGKGWQRREDGYTPNADEVNEWHRRSGAFGHDGVNMYVLVRERLKRAGIRDECEVCDGTATRATVEQHQAYEAWEPTDPPAGDGWQLWETTTEGSPKSPVFKTPEELAAWCADHATVFADMRATYGEWLRMIVGDTLDVGSLAISVGGGPLTFAQRAGEMSEYDPDA